MYEVLNAYEGYEKDINGLEYLIKNKSIRFSVKESKQEKSFYFDDIKFMYLDKIKNLFYIKRDNMFQDIFWLNAEDIEDILYVNVNIDSVLFEEYMIEYLKLFDKTLKVVVINRYGETNTEYLKQDKEYKKAVQFLWLQRKLKQKTQSKKIIKV